MSTIYFEKVDNNIYMTSGIEKKKKKWSISYSVAQPWQLYSA